MWMNKYFQNKMWGFRQVKDCVGERINNRSRVASRYSNSNVSSVSKNMINNNQNPVNANKYLNKSNLLILTKLIKNLHIKHLSHSYMRIYSFNSSIRKQSQLI